MRTIVLFGIACLLGCGASFDSESTSEDGSGGMSAVTSTGGGASGGAGTSNWSDTGHQRRKLVTIPELGNLTPVSSFVVPVMLDADTELAGNAEPDGRDIYFTADDGKEPLSHELEMFTEATGRLVAWVRVPQLKEFGETQLYMYYDHPEKMRWADTEATWRDVVTSAWHLSDDLGAAVPVFADSGAGANPGSVKMGSPRAADGVAGNALGLDGATVIDIDESPDDTLGFAFESFTYSIWLKTTSPAPGVPFFHSGTCNPGCRGYAFRFDGGPWRATLSDGSDGGWAPASFGAADALADGVWHLFTAVVDREANELRVYVDGAQTNLVDIGHLADLTPTYGAAFGTDNAPVLGDMDEVRVYPRALSPDEVLATFASLVTLRATVGSEETIP